MSLEASARDRVYAGCANAITQAGLERESLYLARLVLLLMERLGDEAACMQAMSDALRDLPTPSLSGLTPGQTNAAVQ